MVAAYLLLRRWKKKKRLTGQTRMKKRETVERNVLGGCETTERKDLYWKELGWVVSRKKGKLTKGEKKSGHASKTK